MHDIRLGSDHNIVACVVVRATDHVAVRFWDGREFLSVSLLTLLLPALRLIDLRAVGTLGLRLDRRLNWRLDRSVVLQLKWRISEANEVKLSLQALRLSEWLADVAIQSDRGKMIDHRGRPKVRTQVRHGRI